MLSILIPTYNYNVLPLVENLFQQCKKANVLFEILVLDDCSTKKEIVAENSKISDLKNCSFQTLETNIGRSKIRNLMAKSAQYDWLLFLDADTFPSNMDFISKYIAAFSKEKFVVFGGIKYPNINDDIYSLRHIYGNKRESLTLSHRLKNPYQSFITMGFAIKKNIFKIINFNENLVGYGYEDSVFAYELKKNNIEIKHIDNPILHLNLETNADFIKKSKLALQNLLDFYESGAIDGESVKVLKIYLKLKKCNLLFAAQAFYSTFKKAILKNLLSPKPSLFLFDLYRLGYLSTLKSKNA